MKIIVFIQDHFWFPVSLSLLLAFVVPSINPIFNQFLIPLVMINFFFSSLKVDVLDVLSHIKKPLLMFYIIGVYLLIIPTLIYFLFHFINPELAIAMLLLSAMPPGASVPMLIHMFKGNMSLGMAITLTNSLIAPFTVVFLFFLLTNTVIKLDLAGLFQTMALVIFIPLFLAQTVRKLNKTLVERTQQYYSLFGIICICLIVFIAVSGRIQEIINIPLLELTFDVIWLYLVFGILFIAGTFVTFWKDKSDRIATGVAKTYMNNALAIGIAATFFSPKIALLMVLSEIPWSTTLGIFKYFLRFLK